MSNNNSIEYLLNKDLEENDIFIHNFKNNMELLVISYSNYENQFSKEFERSLTQNDIPYILAGFGEKWINFRNKTIKYYKILKYLEDKYPNLLTIVCDCHDILFFENAKEIVKRYSQINPEKKIYVVGEMFLNPGIPEVKKCSEKTVKNDNYYPNSGFLMGPLKKLIPVLDTMKDNIDDQIGLQEYIIKHCDEFFIDDSNKILLLDVSFPFGKKVNLVIKNGKVYNTITGSYPCAIHILGMSYYPKKRSEYYRNLIFSDRDPICKSVYDKMFEKRFKISKVGIVISIFFLMSFINCLLFYFSKVLGMIFLVVFFVIFCYCMTFHIDL